MSATASCLDRGASETSPGSLAQATSSTVWAHLSARRYVYSVPTLGNAEWVVVDLDDPCVIRERSPLLYRVFEELATLVAALQRDPAWTVAFEREGGVLVFRRASAS